MYYFADEQMIEQWVIQIPLALIFLEIIAICIIRCIIAFMAITKYRQKRYDYYQAPILDNSYFAGAPSYVEKYEKGDIIQKAAVSDAAAKKLNSRKIPAETMNIANAESKLDRTSSK